MTPPALSARGGDVLVSLKVVPGASRSRVVGLLGDRWKVAVAAPPEAGEANEAARRVLAEALGVPASAVRIEAGASSPRKTAAVAGTTVALAEAALARASR